jgi:hypothetical protein
MKICENWRLTFSTSYIHITRQCVHCSEPTLSKIESAAEFLLDLAEIVSQDWIENPTCIECAKEHCR